ncbi:ribosomal protein S7 domain-containing protein [Mycena floridula]|nr:ribosomal protein S7 domain-containing protein [Mycena floridula]
MSYQYDPSIGGYDMSKNDAETLEQTKELLEIPDATEDPDEFTASFLPVARSKLAPFINLPPQDDPLLHLLSSCLMRDGKRARANRIVAGTLQHIHGYTRAPPLPILRQAIFSASPLVRCMKHKHGTQPLYRPVALSEKQSMRAGIKWIVEATDNRRYGSTWEERLAREMIDIIVNPNNSVVKLREEAHKKAMINRGNMFGVGRR